MDISTRPFEVMAKPIGPRCNLACTYCYYLEKEKLYPHGNKYAMPEEVLETFVRDYIISQVETGRTEVGFNWQGGEPTILGVAYFKNIIELQKRHTPSGIVITNAIQTNGTLLDDEWATFLKDNHFLVGLSLDGPPSLHDPFRVDPKGEATHSRAMAALALLLRYNIEFNTLTVVHRRNAASPRAVYRFLRDAGSCHMQFIPVVERLGSEGSLAAAPQIDDEGTEYPVAPWSVLPKTYGDFLCGVFDDWIKEDVGKVFVQLFDVQLGLWMGAPAGLCWYAETCGSGLALEHNGDLFACDHYVYPEYLLGNILENPLSTIGQKQAQIDFGLSKRKTLAHQCLKCSFRFACNGGCPKHRFLKTMTGEPLNYFCMSHRIFFEHAGARLLTMAKLVRSGRPAAEIMRPPSRSRAANNNQGKINPNRRQ